ncbi:ParB/RepB/Spo0J family partition protein [Clostridium intestinale]|uniref:ParB/RepB/Spo0J family partition protein n=1 Tax=Clostridium intestinale TaxID=36845 RepID=A0A7D6VXU0_9CLOT|nr:ParB/RepB/Spo0J family partition protein [Clostridium intestinale]QLY78065.1 ParB/RepB/Spo0J family partition protein [Clostridium intestinale]
MSWLDDIADKINKEDEVSNERSISLDKLIPSTKNFYGIRNIDELAESIKKQGLLQNLVVREMNTGYFEILAGHRRYTALKQLGEAEAKCNVLKNINDEQAEIILIITNKETRELTPTEKMKGVRRLEKLYKSERTIGDLKGKTRDLIGEAMGLSGTQIGRYMKIDKKLDEELKENLDKDKITLSQAEIVSNLKPEEQKQIAKQIKELDPKESKEEINILIEGIKQPVERKRDKELLKEIYPEPKAKEKKPKSDKFIFKDKEQLKTIEALCEERVKTLKDMLPKEGQKWTEFDYEVKGQFDAFDLMRMRLRDSEYSDGVVFEIPGIESCEED